ncbi:MAG: c-type cytochrome [Burkholderiaceae bacterium]
MKRMLSRMVVASGVLLGTCVVSISHASGVATPDAAKGEELYANGDMARGVISCASCHGAAGNSIIPINPNISGQPYEYLVKQLLDFKPKGDHPPIRNGADGAPSLMAPMAAPLTEEDIRNVSYYLSMQRLDLEAAPTATNEDTMERGQEIWRGGIASRGVPACAGCHSPNGAGVPGKYPRIGGQHPDYIADQMRLFRSGDRANSTEMFEIADRMSDRDIAAVADYAAGLR